MAKHRITSCMNESPSREEIKQGLRTGYSFGPRTPGLQEVARDLFRPIIAGMEGREIIHVCRFPQLLRIDVLDVDVKGFRAVGTPTHDFGRRIRIWGNLPRVAEPQPLEFGSRWDGLRLCGSCVCIKMITDHFYPDAAVVAEVKAAVARNGLGEISSILERASRPG